MKKAPAETGHGWNQRICGGTSPSKTRELKTCPGSCMQTKGHVHIQTAPSEAHLCFNLRVLQVKFKG